jgi:hypothetical protein
LRELIVCIFRDVLRGGTQQSLNSYEIPVLAPCVAPGKSYGQHAAFDIPIAIKGTFRRPHTYDDIDEVVRGKRTVVDRGANDATRVYDLADKSNRSLALTLYEERKVGDWGHDEAAYDIGDGVIQDESSF